MALPTPQTPGASHSHSISRYGSSSGYATSPNYTTYGTPDEMEETVTTEEWEEERNGVMVKVRKTTTKRTKRNRSATPYWSGGGINTDTFSYNSSANIDPSSVKFDFVKTDDVDYLQHSSLKN